MRVHILRASRRTFCDKDAARVRKAVWDGETFEIALALEEETLCWPCSRKAGV